MPRLFLTIAFIVRDVKIIQGEDKFFVAMPSKKMKDGSFRDTVHPLESMLHDR